MTVNSTSSSSMSSMLGVTGKGIGGLATGLDTDSLVEALTSGTRSKIAKQGQQKQLLNWKMTAYRTMSTALTSFQSKYLKLGSSSNIGSNSFFNTYKATSSSDKISVSTTSASTTGSFTIDKVKQLATSEKVTSTNKLSSTISMSIKGNTLDTDGTTVLESVTNVGVDAFKGKTLKLEVDGFAVKTIKLDDLNSLIDSSGNINSNDFTNGLQALIDKAYGTKTAVENEDGTFTSTHVIDVSTDENGFVKLDSDSARIFIGATNDVLGVTGGQTNRVSENTKLGALDAFKNVQGNSMTFSINGYEIEVTKDDTITSLMTKVNNSSANVRMEYDKFNDKFTLTSKSTGAGQNMTVRDLHGNLMNEIFGVQSGNGVGTGFLTTGASVTSIDPNTIDGMSQTEKKNLASDLSKMTFKMTLNGVTKTVTVDATLGIDSTKLKDGTYTSDDVYNAINKGITNAFYGSNVSFSKDASGKTVVTSLKTLVDDNGNAILDGNGKATLVGDPSQAFSMEIEGRLGTLLGTGADKSIIGNSVIDYGYDKTIEAGTVNANGMLTSYANGGVFDMTIDGVTKQIVLSKDVENKNLVSSLNAAIKTAFGADVASKVYFSGKNNTTTNDDGATAITSVDLKLNISDTKSVTVSASDASDVGAGQRGIYSALGFSGTSATNATGGGTLMSELASRDFGAGTLTIGHVEYDVNGNPTTTNAKTVSYSTTNDDGSEKTLNQFLTDLNAQLDGVATAGIKNGKLYIDSTSDTISIKDTGNMLSSLFGITDDSKSFVTKSATYMAKDDAGNYVGGYEEGKNAEIVINGKVVSSASNTISYNNVNITVNETTNEKITVGVQSNPDEVIKGIKEWMEDYNALVYTLNSAISEGKNNDYSPLTDEQKENMTEAQINKWETEAKKGILRNDQTLRGILADMRATFYNKVESAGISLYDIGIVTKSGLTDSNEAGQLEFDKNISGGGEQRLRDMLTNNPDAVRLLFADSENGIAAKLNNVITKAASESSTNRGSLVRLAGTEKLTGDNTSQLKDKISAIDKYITQLKSRLESEFSRYWKKFSALETSVQKLNSQSSWLQSS